ncbi:PASTA domain-containing protein [Mesonia maritima]|uniref:Beta-lactam-binding protein with PASTA domain n=1 Tax=Mesonia maritima TaxID=1793873 RepID=A0ABU1K7D8_9FLAO|nr:PASTA domain-containing protein [Mesonia maritima]MDR6301511.1 beta-lactam-binding protein with PASTA domain [Mesonia maritima]
MSFFKFIFSKKFLLQLVIAALVVVILGFLSAQWLNYTTNHDQRIKVPDLSRLSLDVVDKKLEEMNLRREILDSANYNPDYPRYAVIEQVPAAGKQVKENRKIYLTLNPSGYAKVEVPKLLGRTKRQVIPTLRSLGFEIGDITYKPDIGKDVVLEMRAKGKTIKAGDKLMKTTVINLVLGDGTRNYNSEE